MENDVSKVASIKRQHIRHVRLHFFAAGYHHRVITHRDVTDVPTFFVRMLGKLLESLT